ncbi:MAG: phycobilisome protein [Oscillatoriales cyanobacterium RM2_1_1]|nr:phycobilisome protein [Oscillatoriales cyanobacterium SM2_3_0]NJO46765.1 phycobilisome protein [Oscillatoriales cyanobacterium RM2_1_1]
MLTQRAQELIPKARIVSFTSWRDIYPDEIIDRFQQADDAGRYLSDEDLAILTQTLVTHPQLQQMTSETQIGLTADLRDQVSEIVTEAREQVLAQYPGITEPGGGLYPPERTQACWRDFWHFLRCITYGIAGGQVQYTNPEGLHYMELLYQELQVPLPAMVTGLEGLKAASLRRIEPEQMDQIAPYFDHLIGQLRQFNSSI